MKKCAKALASLAHVAFGMLAALLQQELLYTVVYIAYQVADYIEEGNAGEVREDIAEYAAGLVTGSLLRFLFLELLT